MTPKYKLIADTLRKRITSGDYKIGDRLPREAALVKAYNASRITIRRALDELRAEGLIYKIQGAGTFIKDNEPRAERQAIALDLIDLSTVEIEVVDFSVVRPSPKVKSILGINDFDFVHDIKRLLRREKLPVAFSHIWMPITLVQGMRMDAIRGSLYDFLRGDLKLTPNSATRRFTVAAATPDLRTMLNVEQRSQLLKVSQRSYLYDERMFEYSETFIATDRYPLVQYLN
ncbi:transcriptional regulator, GntR family [Coriobacterium glomerans PW2]|uniref:Transcriptional regulator, GntR family n=1 Tax=Coriobacterium glomerans (strain ATCC 49209 / DSM 20642 / JCM 10262 / PW2) TaxID=700015 RepID=F2NB39_CORGP|nr:GntR family transcriptional regulator [Coriobacterium glomerans]AEB07790.1 transcriptional regulator, GntR family [Coriobacterium glomerans PW2]